MDTQTAPLTPNASDDEVIELLSDVSYYTTVDQSTSSEPSPAHAWLNWSMEEVQNAMDSEYPYGNLRFRIGFANPPSVSYITLPPSVSPSVPVDEDEDFELLPYLVFFNYYWVRFREILQFFWTFDPMGPGSPGVTCCCKLFWTFSFYIAHIVWIPFRIIFFLYYVLFFLMIVLISFFNEYGYKWCILRWRQAKHELSFWRQHLRTFLYICHHVLIDIYLQKFLQNAFFFILTFSLWIILYSKELSWLFSMMRELIEHFALFVALWPLFSSDASNLPFFPPPEPNDPEEEEEELVSQEEH